MPAISRKQSKIVCKGLNLSLPPDLLPDGYFPQLDNCNLNQLGELEARPGSATFLQGYQSFVHSIRRLNNEIPDGVGDFLRVIGAGNGLYGGQNVLDTGFSGNPLSLIPYRPDQSPEPWMYVFDANKNVKVRVDGTVQGVGVLPPSAAPDVELAKPLYDNVDITGAWTSGGQAGPASTVIRVAASTTIENILYDKGNGVGWANVVPVNGAVDYAWLGAGEAVIFNSAETCVISEVHTPNVNSTIQSIIYDAGTTGLCSIVLTGLASYITRNAILYFSSTEYVRVLSVTPGPNGTFSIRCSTTGAFAAGAQVTGKVSFRVFTIATYVATQSITGDKIVFGTAAVGDGWISKTIAIDLSTINGRAVQLDDYMHVSIEITNPLALIEGRVMLDVDGATNDFTQNFYYKAFRPNDLSPAVTAQLPTTTTAQTIVSNNVYDEADPRAQSLQLSNGNAQYSELIFKISDLVRVGTDLSRTLANIQAIRLYANFNVTTDISLDSWWVGGTYGPDVNIGSPTGMQYQYRYRSSLTGAKSTPSPPERYFLYPSRQAIDLTCTSSTDPQVDLIDIQRYDPNLQGGTTPTWVTVATIKNSDPVFQDQAVSTSIAANPPLETDVFKPFPVLSTPMKGLCNVSGTSVTLVSGDAFPALLSPGTVITIGSPGQATAYQIYTFPLGGNFLEIFTSGGTGFAVPFQIASPVLIGQPLPIAFGPLEGPLASFLFALGDPLNPGTLYWTNGNDPDSASDKNTIEITSPSEPLIGGVVWNTLVYVFSRERVFILRPSFDSTGNFQFTFYAIPAPSGLWSNWAVCAGYDGVYFLGRDGLYRIAGEETSSITDELLYPLFPHQGEPGVGTPDYAPVDMTQYPYLRMAFAEGDIYFNCKDSNEISTCYRWDTTVRGFFHHKYPIQQTFEYWEETPENVQPLLLLCSDTGVVSQVVGQTDDLLPITAVFRTPSFDNGDARAQKLYLDAMTDLAGTASLVLGFNNNSLTLPPQVVSYPGTVRGQVNTNIASIADLTLYRNVCAQYTFNFGTRIYEFEASFYMQPYLMNSYVSRGDQGFPDWILARDGVFAVISNADVYLLVDIDGKQYTYTLPNTFGQLRKVYTQFQHGSKGRMFVWQLKSGTPFAFFSDETMVRLKDWRGSLQQLHPFDPQSQIRGLLGALGGQAA